jgi:hypothetical protein
MNISYNYGDQIRGRWNVVIHACWDIHIYTHLDRYIILENFLACRGRLFIS